LSFHTPGRTGVGDTCSRHLATHFSDILLTSSSRRAKKPIQLLALEDVRRSVSPSSGAARGDLAIRNGGPDAVGRDIAVLVEVPAVDRGLVRRQIGLVADGEPQSGAAHFHRSSLDRPRNALGHRIGEPFSLQLKDCRKRSDQELHGLRDLDAPSVDPLCEFGMSWQ
jgi:hypothetical protein